MVLFKAVGIDKEWHFGTSVIEKNEAIITLDGVECYTETLCQYTTYEDKDKKKIFVNDRVQIRMDGLIYNGTVVFQDGRLVVDFDEEAINKYFSRTDLMFWKKFMVVIGNLHK